MENNKRIMLSLAMVAIIAVAAIGAGYAYTAMTTNSGNSASSEYITLAQDGNAAYKFTGDTAKVYWDTENTKTNEGKIKTTYKISETTQTVTVYGVEYKVVALAVAPIEIKATATGITQLEALNCTFNTNGFTFDGNAVFIIAFSNSSEMSAPTYSLITSTDSWSDNQFTISATGSTYNTKYVQVYYGYTGDGVVVTANNISGDGSVGSPPAENVLNSAWISFVAHTNLQNGTTDYQLTSITLSAQTTTISSGGTTTITPAANDSLTLPEGGTWTSLKPTVATVTNGTVTGVAAGIAPIVYKNGDYTVCIEITVTAS